MLTKHYARGHVCKPYCTITSTS